MTIAGLLVLAALLIGCATVNVSQGWGKHGPEKSTDWESSKDVQSSTDSINELSNKISGIDKSQNEISRKIDKTSDVQQMQVERDEAIDRKSPFISKEERRKIYKGK